jgi:hypothetical protein
MPPIQHATKKSTGWSPKIDFTWRLPSQPPSTSQCQCRLKDIQYRARVTIARSLGRVQVHLNFLSITTFREAYLLDVKVWEVNKWNCNKSSKTTEGYDWWRQRTLPLMQSHTGMLSITPMNPTITYPEIFKLHVWMVGGVSVRNWRCGGCGICSDVSFCSIVSFYSLLFISSFYPGQVHMASSQGLTRGEWMWSFPVRHIRRTVPTELYQLVVRHIGCYNCVCSMNVSFFVSRSFTPFMRDLAAQEVCTYRGG